MIIAEDVCSNTFVFLHQESQLVVYPEAVPSTSYNFWKRIENLPRLRVERGQDSQTFGQNELQFLAITIIDGCLNQLYSQCLDQFVECFSHECFFDPGWYYHGHLDKLKSKSHWRNIKMFVCFTLLQTFELSVVLTKFCIWLGQNRR